LLHDEYKVLDVRLQYDSEEK
jgi:hypothetical protein